MVICDQLRYCDEAKNCGGSVPHREQEECGKCVRNKGAKCIEYDKEMIVSVDEYADSWQIIYTDKLDSEIIDRIDIFYDVHNFKEALIKLISKPTDLNYSQYAVISLTDLITYVEYICNYSLSTFKRHLFQIKDGKGYHIINYRKEKE